MLAEALLPDYQTEATGAAKKVWFPEEYVIHIETIGTETPSPHAWESLLTLRKATGCLTFEEDAAFLVEKAFAFMYKAAKILPFSDDADKAGDALIKKVRGNLTTRRLTRKASR